MGIQKNKDDLFWKMLAEELGESDSSKISDEQKTELLSESRYRRIYETFHSYKASPDYDEDVPSADEVLQMTYDKIFRHPAILPRKILKYLGSIAASVAILVCLGIGYLFLRPLLGGGQEEWIEYYCQSGGFSRLVLSDSTEVFLNANTTLRYPRRFTGEMRTVRIDGEAYFNVAKNKKKPFIVHNDAFDIKVYGTSFNVKAYRDSENIETTLICGKIEIVNAATGETRVMAPKQMVSISRGDNRMEVEEVDTDHHSAWINGGIAFDKCSFSEICKTLERRFGLNILISDRALSEMVFSCRFIHNEGLYQILDVIRMNADFTYALKGNNVLVISAAAD